MQNASRVSAAFRQQNAKLDCQGIDTAQVSNQSMLQTYFNTFLSKASWKVKSSAIFWLKKRNNATDRQLRFFVSFPEYRFTMFNHICQQSEIRCCYHHRYYQIRAQDASFNNSISSTDFFLYIYIYVSYYYGGVKKQ